MNYNKGKKLLSERFYLTWAGEQMSWTVRMTLKMRDAVDGDLLRLAVESTRQRYPYYQVKLGMRKDAEGTEYFVYEDNSEPWVTSKGETPVRLIAPESNNHLLAFCYWDDCIAIDFFHCLTDGTGAYNILRTLLYNYSCRRYDATLSHERISLPKGVHIERILTPEGMSMANIRVAGDTISPEEWEDPAAQAKPDHLHPFPLPERPHCVNLTTQAKAMVNEAVETVNILVEEQEMMKYVSSSDTSPATLVSLLLSRAIAHLHPDLTEGVPMVSLAINQRPALGCPQAGQTMASALRLTLNNEMRGMNLEMQQTIFRGMVVLQSNDDNVIENFWQSQNTQDLFEKIPTLEGRHQAMVKSFSVVPSATTACVSYVGKANLGAAEQYVSEMYTEAYTPFALAIEMSAVGGTFCISLMQRFADDTYLEAFLDEFRQIGLQYRIATRHPTTIAPIANYRELFHK
ncbi:MAG: hypothetical protein J6S94_05665 [Bacteroidaceae bacterium]|nr:hypothetical protein [Bacteroidaceae bacterium]